MTIHAASANLHWNYFLALESDMEQVSRYIEFDSRNLHVFSIELAHLLFAAASEADVVAKALCEAVQPGCGASTIHDYRRVLVATLPDIRSEHVHVPRYGLQFAPWLNWNNAADPANPTLPVDPARPLNPDWWKSYNLVKHKRDRHFDEATLKNALNALGALLLLVVLLQGVTAGPTAGGSVLSRGLRLLQPESTFMQLNPNFYAAPMRWAPVRP